ncbi:MAG: histidinol-phosphate transaminase [Candidatus Omnitrophota bacterium]
MILPKRHLKELKRISPDNRPYKLCLDMNEGQGLTENFVNKVCRKIDVRFMVRYPEYDEVIKQIAAHDRICPDNICLSNGSDAAIKYIFDAYVSEGDRVLFVNPTFAMYSVYSAMFNAEVVNLEYGQDFSFPLEQFQQMLSHKIRLAIIVNPNNPTGTAISPKDLLLTVQIAHKNNVLLVVDEAYFYFYSKTMIKKIKEFNNLIVLRTFSKLCSLAALRIGYAAACPDIINYLKKVRPTFDVNSVAVLFAQQLFSSPKIIEGMIVATDEGKEYLINQLRVAGIGYKNSVGNFILIECKGRIDEIVNKLKEKGILIHGGFKQDFLKNYIRVTAVDKAKMIYFWRIFIKILNG